MTDRWTVEWPKKPGDYWFYGWPWRAPDPCEKARMYFVKVRRAQKNLVFVTDGIPMNRSGVGKWLEASVPDPPPLWMDDEK